MDFTFSVNFVVSGLTSFADVEDALQFTRNRNEQSGTPSLNFIHNFMREILDRANDGSVEVT